MLGGRISHFSLNPLQKIIWIGPVKFVDPNGHTNGASKLAKILDQLSQGNCEVTVIGNLACQLMRQENKSLSSINLIENASVVWEFLKGRKLPGVTAVDRVCLCHSSSPYYRRITVK